MKSVRLLIIPLSVALIPLGLGCLKDVNVQQTLGQIAGAANTSTGSSQPSASQPTASSGGAGSASGILSRVAPIANNNGLIFSKSPITPGSPGGGSTSFQAGDYIYGFITLKDSFSNLTKGQISKNATKIDNIEIKTFVDDEYKTSFYLIPLKPAFDRREVVFDIVPEIDKMTAFKDPDYRLEAHRKPAGPLTFSQVLADLSRQTPGQDPGIPV